MEPGPLIARLEEAGVSLDDIQGLPRKLRLPNGIPRLLRFEGILRKIKKDKESCIIWGTGPQYVALITAWSRHKEHTVGHNRVS
jgi:hypothetical protein